MNYHWDWTAVTDNIPQLLGGLKTTVLLAVYAMAFSLVGGLLLALMRRSRLPPLSSVALAIVEFFRTTPFLVQVFWIYYLLPQLVGFRPGAFITGVCALGLNVSAFNCEILRAGINSVGKGQVDAALALGMTQSQAMLRIILPQAIRRVIPPLGSAWVSIFKDTAILSVIAVGDLTYEGILLRGKTFRDLEILTAIALMYLVLGYPQAKLVDSLYRRIRTQE